MLTIPIHHNTYFLNRTLQKSQQHQPPLKANERIAVQRRERTPKFSQVLQKRQASSLIAVI
jgi:hypothetical protein